MVRLFSFTTTSTLSSTPPPSTPPPQSSSSMETNSARAITAGTTTATTGGNPKIPTNTTNDEDKNNNAMDLQTTGRSSSSSSLWFFRRSVVPASGASSSTNHPTRSRSNRNIASDASHRTPPLIASSLSPLRLSNPLRRPRTWSRDGSNTNPPVGGTNSNANSPAHPPHFLQSNRQHVSANRIRAWSAPDDSCAPLPDITFVRKLEHPEASPKQLKVQFQTTSSKQSKKNANNNNNIHRQSRPRFNSRDIPLTYSGQYGGGDTDLLPFECMRMHTISPTIFFCSYMILLSLAHMSSVFIVSGFSYLNGSNDPTATTCDSGVYSAGCNDNASAYFDTMFESLLGSNISTNVSSSSVVLLSGYQFGRSFVHFFISLWTSILINTWVVTNILHFITTVFFIHWIKGRNSFLFISEGVPFDEQGEMNAMTVWEQLEAVPDSTMIRKILLIVPTILAYVASVSCNFETPTCILTITLWCISIIAKLPFMNGVRLFGINRTAGIDDDYFLDFDMDTKASGSSKASSSKNGGRSSRRHYSDSKNDHIISSYNKKLK